MFTAFHRAAAAAFLLASLSAPAFAITGGIAVDEVLAAGVGGRYTVQQTAFARAVSVSTVSVVNPGIGGCSGTIVHPRVILTAAHCVLTGRDVSEKISVHFGNGFAAPSKRQMVDVVAHPEFMALVQDRSYKPERQKLDDYMMRTNSTKRYMDLALVLLHRPIPESHQVVEIVPAGYRDSRTSRKLIAGYGRTYDGAPVDNLSLHFAEMHGNTRTDQGDITGEDEIVMESRYSDGTRVSVCQGDSGGPVYVADDRAGLRQLAVSSAADKRCRETAVFVSLDSQRAMLRQMFDTLMEGEQGVEKNPF